MDGSERADTGTAINVCERVTDEGLKRAIAGTKGAVLVAAFFQVGTPPCENFLPEFDALADSFDGPAKFVKIEVTENPSVAERFRVEAYPVTLVFKDGSEVARWEGPYSQETLEKRLATLVGRGPYA